MATDQPTDATAARLRERVVTASIWHARESARKTQEGPEAVVDLESIPALDAALDTLIRYHAARGAVEALEAVLAASRGSGDLIFTLNVFRDRIRTQLAAAQERLAAYEQEAQMDRQGQEAIDDSKLGDAVRRAYDRRGRIDDHRDD